MQLANGVLVSVAEGRQTVGPFTVPKNLDRITLRMNRCTTLDPLTWPNKSTQVNMVVYVNGVAKATIGAVGGIFFDEETNREISAIEAEVTLEPGDTDRQIKVDLDVVMGPLVSVFAMEAIARVASVQTQK